MDQAQGKAFIGGMWDDSILPTLIDYIRIPNKSPAFDPDWATHGHMDAAVRLFEGWARAKLASVPDATLEVVRLPGRTPVIFIEIPGSAEGTVVLYGHLDKQPEMVGWSEGTGPFVPVLRDGKLYGRGGADDGYAMFASLAALLSLREQDVPHARAVVLIEACEESGSTDLPFYVDHLAERIGEPSLVVCLDSGCGDYERLWLTTSLRGTAAGNLTVRVLTEGVHSGSASGIVPSSFRILRTLLARLEDETSGRILVEAFHAPIPEQRVAQARQTAQILGSHIYDEFPFAPGVHPLTQDLSELILNRTWRPQLSVTGMEGLPRPRDAGNVMLPYTTVRLSLRLPPSLPAGHVTETLKRLLESDPPYGAKITFEGLPADAGWDAPALAPWLEKAVTEASQAAFGKPAAYMGEGGSIPFMDMLGKRFPKTQFVVTGVLGPQSNAHGPNEFLHIETGKRVTECIAHILAAHGARR
jgi:acetylornithine deacetylase/succinyl-diaminopimelate desuccinylase-like protein